MRVLFEELPAAKRAGGIEMATGELKNHLEALGVCVERKLPLERSDRLADYQHSTLSSQLLPHGGRPDCVHFHGIWSPALARRLAAWKRRGIPCLVTPHGMLEPWALAHKRLKKAVAWYLYQKRILNLAGALHATALKEAMQLVTLGLRSPRAVVPWGITMPAPVAHVSSLSTSRTALFLGRIYPVKGLPLLVEAWARVRPAGWKMKIVGPDEAGHRAEVESMLRERGLLPNFEFTGLLRGHEKALAYAGAQLFILPSHTENFGMAIGEALSHGLPVITTTGTPWEQLRMHRCGWWVEAQVEALADVLGQATRLPAHELEEMGARGRKLINEQYSWPRVATQMQAVYEWLLGKRERPACVCQAAGS